MKKPGYFLAMLLIAVSVLFGGCEKETGKEALQLTGLDVIHELEFGGVYLKMTIDEFNAAGFEYGDSVDVRFSNGYSMEDLPYYNGYYTQAGEALLVAYPGYDYIKVAVNYGDDAWVLAGLSEGMTADVELAERGKYRDIQEIRNIHYEDEREKYESDAVFANFRAIAVGNVKENFLYRSASPCDNQHNRAPYVDALMKEAGVQYIVDLSDTEEKIQKYLSQEDFASPYFQSLYEAGKVIPIAMNMNFSSEEFRTKVVKGLTAMLENDGPYLIHCTEGKDRTGFVCMLLEALSGASYEDIVEDYMITYRNYYGITFEKDAVRYKVIVENMLDPMIRAVAGEETADLSALNLSEAAVHFLTEAGMSEEQAQALKEKISKE